MSSIGGRRKTRQPSQAEPDDEGGDPKPVRGNGTSLFEGTPGGGGVQATEEEEERHRQDAPVEPVHRGEGRTAEDEAEERLDRQEQHDVGGDPR